MRCGLDWCSVTPYCHVAGLLPWDRHHAEVIFVHLGIRLAFGKSIALQAAWSVQRKAVLQISEFREGFAFLVCEHTGASCVDARISMDAATSHRSLARRALAAARCALVAAARSLPLARRPLARSPLAAARCRSRSLPLAARSPPARSPRSPLAAARRREKHT